MQDQPAVQDMMGAMAQPEAPTEQYQATLKTVDGDHIIATADSVAGLGEQAKYWMGSTDAAAKMSDSIIKSVVVQEINPETGEVTKDIKTLPAGDKQEVIKQLDTFGQAPAPEEEMMDEGDEGDHEFRD